MTGKYTSSKMCLNVNSSTTRAKKRTKVKLEYTKRPTSTLGIDGLRK